MDLIQNCHVWDTQRTQKSLLFNAIELSKCVCKCVIMFLSSVRSLITSNEIIPNAVLAFTLGTVEVRLTNFMKLCPLVHAQSEFKSVLQGIHKNLPHLSMRYDATPQVKTRAELEIDNLNQQHSIPAWIIYTCHVLP